MKKKIALKSLRLKSFVTKSTAEIKGRGHSFDNTEGTCAFWCPPNLTEGGR